MNAPTYPAMITNNDSTTNIKTYSPMLLHFIDVSVSYDNDDWHVHYNLIHVLYSL